MHIKYTVGISQTVSVSQNMLHSHFESHTQSIISTICSMHIKCTVGISLMEYISQNVLFTYIIQDVNLVIYNVFQSNHILSV
jgi:hypothetical protein